MLARCIHQTWIVLPIFCGKNPKYGIHFIQKKTKPSVRSDGCSENHGVNNCKVAEMWEAYVSL
jgi:hypothetical protein